MSENTGAEAERDGEERREDPQQRRDGCQSISNDSEKTNHKYHHRVQREKERRKGRDRGRLILFVTQSLIIRYMTGIKVCKIIAQEREADRRERGDKPFQRREYMDGGR
jgi:hypothetical protein